MAGDSYYLGYISRTNSIKAETKNVYLKKIAIIQQDILKQSIEYILQHPTEFLIHLNIYAANTKGRQGSSLGDHTKDIYFASIMSLFYSNQSFKEANLPLYNKWKELHDSVRKPLNDKYKSNIPTDRQKSAHVPFDKIIEIRNKLDISLERLLLFMYTEIPPVRSDYHKTLLLNGGEILTDNYIDMSKSMLVLRKYKTSAKYGIIYVSLGPVLMKEIRNSLTKQPREYLFVDSAGKPYEIENSFNKWANRSLKSIFGLNNMSLSILRHEYVSRRDLMLETKSGAEQQEIARIMGHSVEQQKKYMWHAWLNRQE